MDPSALQYWLTYFVLKVRKQNGLEYPLNTPHDLVCGITCYLRQSGKPEVDFFEDDAFADIRTSLDVEMKLAIFWYSVKAETSRTTDTRS